MGRRTIAGGRVARGGVLAHRSALGLALAGLVLAGAALAPAIASDEAPAGGLSTKSGSAAKAGAARASRPRRQSHSVASVKDDVRFHSAEASPTNSAPLTPSAEGTAWGAAASPVPVNEPCFAGCPLIFPRPDGGTTTRIYSQSDFVQIGAVEAWEVTHGDPEMLVAVLDTDVDASHPDLAGKVIVGQNFSGDTLPDPEGHATAVAGLIAATPNNGVGIAGLGWSTKVLSVRVLDRRGNGLASDIARGVRYAADYPGVKIINLSLQQDASDAGKVSEMLREAISYAQSKGLLVVSAAGNQPVDTPSFPANFDGVLSVAALDGADDSLAKFSRYGPWVDIAAPGVGVLTLATPCADGNCWVAPDGTSFAAPIVSAAAALVWSASPGLRAEQVAARLMDSADSVSGTGTQFISGKLNVGRALAVTTVTPATPVTPLRAVAPGVVTSTSALPVPPVRPSGKGYWLASSDGGVFNYGNATFLGSTGGLALNRPIVGLAATPSGKGYWLVASDGGIFAFGDAAFFGSTGAMTLNKPIVGMAATDTGRGYWLVASDGGIFAFGDAAFVGSAGAMTLNRPIVGVAATPSGKGYWLVASDGGIFAFGDAAFFGSTGNVKLNRPIVDLAPSPDGDGYWLVASDGGVFAFGAAPFYGSPVGTATGSVVGLASTPSGNGYWIVGNDGRVYNFGGAQFLGGLGGTPLNRPIVGLAIR